MKASNGRVFWCRALLLSWSLGAMLQVQAAVPRILEVDPGAAVSGSTINIRGENFSAGISEDVVRFGAVRGTVVSATETNLQVTVPACASFGPLIVTVNGLSAASPKPFLPTFRGGAAIVAADSMIPAFTASTPTGPTPVAFADLDQDGKPDIVIGNGAARSIWMLRNISTNGPLSRASFDTPIEIPFPLGDVYKIRAADVDGDGKLDLLIASVNLGQISIFRNVAETAGAIAFAPRIDITTGADCRFVNAADLDGDGRLDLLTVNFGDNSISLFRNVGSPGNLSVDSFAPRVDLPAPSGPYELVVGDLDADGKADVVVATYGGFLSVYRNSCAPGVLDTASFTRIDFPSPAQCDTLEIGDLDGDGLLDVVLGSIENRIAVFHNLGTAPFSTNSLAAGIEFPTDHWTHDVALADFDGDGKPDVAADGELPSFVSIWQNFSSSGAFTASSLGARLDYASGWNAWGLAVGDLDGDGRPDMALANHWDSTFTVYQNLSPFAAPPVILSQPVDQFVVLGDPAGFQVKAWSSPDTTYQWWHGDTLLAGAIGSSLIFPETQEADAGNYFVVLTNSFGSVTSAIAVLSFTNVPPYITAQPQDLPLLRGGTAEFSVLAKGTPSLTYQWRFNGTNLAGATEPLLTLTNVQRSQAGHYSVQISNDIGATNSRDALLTVQVPPSQVTIGGTNTVSGWPVTVPVQLNASGEENAVSFSLVFGTGQREPGLLSFAGVSLAPGLTGASLVLNTNDLGYGRVGIGVALPAGQALPQGTQDLVLITFNTAVVTQSKPAGWTIYFYDRPLPRQVSDPMAVSLPAIFTAGSITLTPTGLEGDTTPRPDGDRLLSLTDWVQAGRFVAGLDVPSSQAEFQRIDCAPRDTRGDGQLKITDWVQAGRYFAGLDPLTAVGGPTSPVGKSSVPKGGTCELRIGETTGMPGLPVTVSIELQARGDENAVGFSIVFDPELLGFSSLEPGADSAGATLQVNSRQANSGKIGLLLALPPGTSFKAGSRQLGTLVLMPKAQTAGRTPVGFADGPVLRALSDGAAQELIANFTDGGVLITTPPELEISLAGTNVIVSWPSSAAGFKVQSCMGASMQWRDLLQEPRTNETRISITCPALERQQFFRLSPP